MASELLGPLLLVLLEAPQQSRALLLVLPLAALQLVQLLVRTGGTGSGQGSHEGARGWGWRCGGLEGGWLTRLWGPSSGARLARPTCLVMGLRWVFLGSRRSCFFAFLLSGLVCGRGKERGAIEQQREALFRFRRLGRGGDQRATGGRAGGGRARVTVFHTPRNAGGVFARRVRLRGSVVTAARARARRRHRRHPVRAEARCGALVLALALALTPTLAPALTRCGGGEARAAGRAVKGGGAVGVLRRRGARHRRAALVDRGAARSRHGARG